MRLLCIGEAMAELRRADDGFHTGFAGDTFNTAVYVQRLLGEGVGFQTRVGTDPLSAGFLDLAAAENLDLTQITRDPDRNIGIYSVQTDAAGERTFHYWRNQSAARGLFGASGELAALKSAGTVYFSGITLAILSPEARAALLARAATLRQAGQLKVAFDSNYRPRLWPDAETARAAIAAAWRIADIALPSVDDEMALFGDADASAVLERLRGWGCTRGALKRGAEGPLSLSADFDGQVDFVPAERVVDTTAAGDSFNAGYLAATLDGRDEATALAWGHATARTVVAHPGAIIPRAATRNLRSA